MKSIDTRYRMSAALSKRGFAAALLLLAVCLLACACGGTKRYGSTAEVPDELLARGDNKEFAVTSATKRASDGTFDFWTMTADSVIEGEEDRCVVIVRTAGTSDSGVVVDGAVRTDTSWSCHPDIGSEVAGAIRDKGQAGFAGVIVPDRFVGDWTVEGIDPAALQHQDADSFSFPTEPGRTYTLTVRSGVDEVVLSFEPPAPSSGQ